MRKIRQFSILLIITIIGFIPNIFNEYNSFDVNQNQTTDNNSVSMNSTDFNNWTIMVYLAADNNLESAGLDDMNEMESVALPEGIELVVLFDRATGHSSADGDWTTTRRYNISYDEDTTQITSDYEDLGELNTGDPNTLEDFIIWSKSTHPAEKYALILWDHGFGASSGSDIGGACVDRESENDYLDLFEIDQAITEKDIDLLGFDCCIMGMMEIASQYQDDIDIFVGSEAVEPEDGWAYDLINIELNENPNCTSEELGEIICSTYAESYRYISYWEDLPMVSMNLNTFAELEEKIYDFISIISQDYNKSIGNIIQKAIDVSQIVESSEDYIDFGDLFSNLESFFHYAYPNLFQLSSEILELYDEIVMSFAIARPRTKTLTGASIRIFPDEDNIGYQSLDFCISTTWHDFITQQKIISVELIDDNYENNDNYNEKQDLSFSESLNLIWSDQDWFNIYIIQNVSFSIILNDTIFQSNEVEIILYDQNLNLIDKDPYNITLKLEQSGYYAICINASFRFVDVSYTLTYIAHIKDDVHEDNDGFSNPTLITTGTYSDLVSLDDDFYQIHVPKSCILDISIYRPDEDFSLYFYLYDSSQNLINYWRTSSFENWSYKYYYMNDEDDFYIKINPYNSFGYYLLNITIEPIEDDPFEDNDIIENACPIEAGYYSDMKVYDVDYYSITINKGENLEINLLYNFYRMNLYIYDEEMNQIYSQRKTIYFNSKFEYISTLSFYSDITQEIIIVVYSLGGFGQYSLEINKDLHKDDIYEENDFIDVAAFIEPGFYSNLKHLDDDFYKFNISQGEYFQATISSNEVSYFNLIFYDSNMEVIISEYSYRENDLCYWYSNINQTIFIEIKSHYNENIVIYYSLNITLGKVDDDVYEQNDLLGEASSITIGHHSNLILNDYDYYNISVLEYESIKFSLESNLYLQLSLYDSEEQLITSALGRTIFFTYYSHLNQSLIIQVKERYKGTYGNYSLEISKELITDDDDFEENDNPESARFIGEGYYSDLIALDDDYYNYSINANEYLEVSLYFRYDRDLNVNLFLYNSNMTLLKSATNTYINKTFTYYSEIAQILVIYVEFAICYGNYSLKINILEDDIFEDNDILQNPANLVYGNHSTLMHLDDDYYSISTQTGMNYLIIVDPNDKEISKSFTMTLYDSNLNFITSGTNNGKVRYYAFTSNKNSSIILRIFNYNSDQRMGSYSINITASLAIEDVYEINEFNIENDFPETPTYIDSGNYKDLFYNDRDYYNISVGTNNILRIRVKFDSDYIQSRSIALFDSNLNSLNTSSYRDGYFHINYLFTNAQYIVIRIFISKGFSTYSMNISLHPFEDDLFEENDLPETATHLDPGYHDNLKSYDQDNYNLTLHEYETLEIQIEINSSIYFALKLLDSNMEILEDNYYYYYSYYPNRYYLRYYSPIDQSVILQVDCGYNAIFYALNISTTFIGLDDSFEENDNPENAGKITSGFYSNLIALDDDYYNLSVQKGDFVEISLSFNTNNLNFDLFVFDSSMTLLYRSISKYEYETLQFYCEKDEDLIILVQSIVGCDIYTLDISIVHFEEDIYEENDNPESAKVIGGGHHINLMCGDNDYYKITVDAGYSLSIWLSSSVNNIDLDMKIYDSDMNLLNSSISCTSYEYIRFFSLRDCEIILLVYSFSGLGLYNISYEYNIIGDDSYEDNDSYETATLISDNNYTGLICLDTDYYTLNISENEQLVIDFEYELTYFELYCIIYDFDMNILYSSKTLPYCYHLNLTFTNNQLIYIEIGSKEGIGLYNFNITITQIPQNQPITPNEGFNLLILILSFGFIISFIVILGIALKKKMMKRLSKSFISN
ncbi:MAG: hypothetical protein KGD63_01415 [Candidatus Lokiarchaeota archaeon]|nr:hypothetical protein [Candidatus Lokiarchaeota archaeon]